MPKRNPKQPWLHEASGYWCKKVAGKLHYLDRDYHVARRKLAAILAGLKRTRHGASNWEDAPFTSLCDDYLDDVKSRRARATYEGYRYRLLRALKLLSSDLRVAEIRRIHLAKIEQGLHGKVSPNTVRDTIAGVQAVFEWAVRNDLLDTNPVRGYVKPCRTGRTRVITPEEFQALLRATAKNPEFRRVLIALRLTGCRPKELRTLTWEMVDLQNRLWIFNKHKTITTQRQPRPRIIPLPEPVWAMCRWMARQSKKPTGHVYLNARGLPYTKDRFVQTMARVRKRAGITTVNGEQIVLYSARHTFGTERAGKVSDMELAELMGHTTTETTRRYVHLNASRLHEIQQRSRRRG